MARRTRRTHAKGQLQSSLLSLPPEIRNQIYSYALLRDSPLDLWPHKWTAKEPDVENEHSPEAAPALNLKTRHQEDLAYIRKEMSTGLLGTCRQVYNEASTLFWGGNHWRFSGRSGWQGLLRFLLTIGPAARTRIRRIDIHAPVYMRWPVKDSDNKDMNGRSKNFPKMHMVKIPAEGHLDRLAIQRVCALLSMDRSVEEINFIVPTGFRNGDEDEFGGYDVDHDMEPESSARLTRIQDLDFIKKAVIVEEGGYLAVNEGPAQMMDKGWDVKCLPGSFIWEKGGEDKGSSNDYHKQEVTATREWRSPERTWDYLVGVKELFDYEDVSVASNGGKQRNHKRPVRPRRLTAFGGCQFIEDEGVVIPLQSMSI